MRVAFAGTPAFACAALQSVHAAGFHVPLVLSQPDRPAGRGMKLQPSAVKQFALAHSLPVAQPRSLRVNGKYPDDALAARAAIEAAAADILVVAAYGLILPQWLLDLPRLGCLNIHGSLLPRWRGAAPIQRAIEAGDRETGITIMQMDAGLDTGDMLLVERLPIGDDDTSASLHDKLAVLGARLIVQALELAASGGLSGTPQPADGVTYARKIEKHEAPIDWRLPAAAVERRIRAFDPFPGATAKIGGEQLKVWRATLASGGDDSAAVPGSVLEVGAGGLRVACGDGALVLTELQRAGGRRMPCGELLRGLALQPGQVFEGLGID